MKLRAFRYATAGVFLLLLSMVGVLALPSGNTYPPTFTKKQGYWFDSWDVSRNYGYGDDGYLLWMIAESMGSNRERAYEVGQQFLQTHPARVSRARAILDYVTTYMKYGYDSEYVFMENVAQEEWAWNPDEMLNKIEAARANAQVAHGDCEDFSFLLGTLYLAAGYDVTILEMPGHAALMIWLPEYENANLYWDVPNDGRDSRGWIWVEGTAGSARVLGVTPSRYSSLQFVEAQFLQDYDGSSLFLGSLREHEGNRELCIIATTTYGSELTPEVQFLRGFRDNLVLSTFAGSQFMQAFNGWYYSFSPEVADVIAQEPVIKATMKSVLYPLLGALRLSSEAYNIFSFNPELGVVMAGLVASLLIGMIYFSPPAALLLFSIDLMLGKSLTLKGTKILVLPLLLSLTLMALCEFTHHQYIMMVSTALFVLTVISISALFGGHGIVNLLKRTTRIVPRA